MVDTVAHLFLFRFVFFTVKILKSILELLGYENYRNNTKEWFDEHQGEKEESEKFVEAMARP